MGLFLLPPQAKEVITGTLSLLRANHPEDCMSCDVNGKCEFQDLITRYKVGLSLMASSSIGDPARVIMLETSVPWVTSLQ